MSRADDNCDADVVVTVDETDDYRPSAAAASFLEEKKISKTVTSKMITARDMFESRHKNLFMDEAHYKSYLELKIGEEHIATVASEKIASEAFRLTTCTRKLDSKLDGGLMDSHGNPIDPIMIRGQVIFDGMITSLNNMYATLIAVGGLNKGTYGSLNLPHGSTSGRMIDELKLRPYVSSGGTHGSLNLPSTGGGGMPSFLMSGNDHDNYLYHNSSPGHLNLSSEVATEFYRQRQDLAHQVAEASKHISTHTKLLKFLNPILHSYWSSLVRGLAAP